MKKKLIKYVGSKKCKHKWVEGFWVTIRLRVPPWKKGPMLDFSRNPFIVEITILVAIKTQNVVKR